MLQDLQIEKSISINASASAVWQALVTPEIIRQYLFGTETVTNWQEGSPIIFQGTYEGTKYQDKGILKRVEPTKCLEYTYWSSFTGIEDVEENYALVTYVIEESEGGCTLTARQRYFASIENQQHAGQNWGMVLEKIKEIVEA
ncbi:MAG: SRPBCC domain-containing protein [Bacteroidota bacterium]